jgi:hypothetical protein
MNRAMLTTSGRGASVSVMRFALLLPMIGLAGCVQVTAPDKPIEINLNVNVRQEVLVRLERDAQELIEQNPELFPR